MRHWGITTECRTDTRKSDSKTHAKGHVCTAVVIVIHTVVPTTPPPHLPPRSLASAVDSTSSDKAWTAISMDVRAIAILAYRSWSEIISSFRSLSCRTCSFMPAIWNAQVSPGSPSDKVLKRGCPTLPEMEGPRFSSRLAVFSSMAQRLER